MKAAAIILCAGALAALAACAGKPKPAPAPPPARPRVIVTPPPAPPPVDWPDRPLTPGEWVYSAGAGGSQALYGPPASEASFVLRCDAGRRQVVLSREGVASAPRLRVRTSSAERTLAATQQTEPLAYLSATLSPSDPLLDAMAFSRGRFAVEAEGLPMLVLPTWPEPARVIEDCRS